MKPFLRKFLSKTGLLRFFRFTRIKVKLIIMVSIVLSLMTVLNSVFSAFLMYNKRQNEAYRLLSAQMNVFQEELEQAGNKLYQTGTESLEDMKNRKDFSLLYTKVLMNEENTAYSKLASISRLRLIIQSSGITGIGVYVKDTLSHYITTEEAGFYEPNMPGPDKVAYKKLSITQKFNLVNWRKWKRRKNSHYFAEQVLSDGIVKKRIYVTDRGLAYEIIIPVKGIISQSFGSNVVTNIAAAFFLYKNGKVSRLEENEVIVGAYVLQQMIDEEFLTRVARKTGMIPGIFHFSPGGRPEDSVQLTSEYSEKTISLARDYAKKLQGGFKNENSDKVLRTVIKGETDSYYHMQQLMKIADKGDRVVLTASLSRKPTLDDIRQTILLFIIIAAIILLLVFIIGFFSIDTVINPLYYLSRAAGRLARGDLDIHLESEADDEFGVVSRTLAGLILQVKEQERIKKEMELAEEIKLLHQEKNLFFLSFAHDIRTPLTIIINLFDKYLKTIPENDDLIQVKKNLDLICSGIVTILDSEKLERTQPFYAHSSPLDLSGLLENKMAFFQEKITGSNLTLTREIEKEVYIKADSSAIDRVINNLLENAVRYNKPGGSIEVTLSATEEKVTLTVKDTGIGMSEEQKSAVFLPYKQGGDKKRSLAGLGLGMYIVKNIVETVQGTITVESRESEGTAFIITCARCKPGENEKIINEYEATAPSLKVNSQKEVAETNIAPGKDTVLLVDDNPDIILFLQKVLKEKYNVYVASNGAKALIRLKSMPRPHLIISDVVMNELDGFGFYDRLMENNEYRGIPFIFLTARTLEEDKVTALSKGAVDYICKPFNVEILKVKVDTLIRITKQQLTKSREQLQKELRQFINQVAEPKADVMKPKEPADNGINLEKICTEYSISTREKEILQNLIEGFTNKEVGEKLKISQRTVEGHVRKIYNKLEVSSRMELLLFLKNHKKGDQAG